MEEEFKGEITIKWLNETVTETLEAGIKNISDLQMFIGWICVKNKFYYFDHENTAYCIFKIFDGALGKAFIPSRHEPYIKPKNCTWDFPETATLPDLILSDSLMLQLFGRTMEEGDIGEIITVIDYLTTVQSKRELKYPDAHDCPICMEFKSVADPLKCCNQKMCCLCHYKLGDEIKSCPFCRSEINLKLKQIWLKDL
jgi:hypothetical protein